MPRAIDLTPISTAPALRAAAAGKERIRIRGVVLTTGEGYSGRYRNAWLQIGTCGSRVRLTATTDSPLGRAREGLTVDLALTLTGMIDVSQVPELIYGERAQLIGMTPRD